MTEPLAEGSIVTAYTRHSIARAAMLPMFNNLQNQCSEHLRENELPIDFIIYMPMRL